VRTYGEMFDRATLVAGERIAARAAARIPVRWGMWTAHGWPVEFSIAREAQDNTEPNARAMAEHLWREEALKLAETHAIDRGIRSKPRDAIWERLAERLPFETIHEAVRNALRGRRYVQQSGARLSWELQPETGTRLSVGPTVRTTGNKRQAKGSEQAVGRKRTGQ